MRVLIVSFLLIFFAPNLWSQETAPVSPETAPAEPTATPETRPGKIKVKMKPSKKSPETRSAQETQPISETTPTTQPVPETAPETSPVEPETTAAEKNPPATGDYKKIVYAEGSTCEAENIEVRPEGYTLRLSFLEGGSESVCGLEVKIKTVKGKSVFQLKSVGSPWLYLDLPPGGYIVWAKAKEGEPVIITTQTSAGRLQKARLFFK